MNNNKQYNNRNSQRNKKYFKKTNSTITPTTDTRVKHREIIKKNPVKRSTLRIVPLGGLGLVGRNCMAIEYEDDILIVDMGVSFSDETTPGVDIIVPDDSYLEVNKHKIRALLITHAHLDHVGAFQYLFSKYNVPVYGAKFTLKFLEKQIEEYNFKIKPQFRTVDPDSHEQIKVGAFSFEFIRVVHSIVDACSIAINTPIGKIIHTGDWRFDDTPYNDIHADKKRFKELGDEGVLMLMSDSTGCESNGKSGTEAKVFEGLGEIFNREKDKRLIVSAFASSITRLQMVIDLAEAHGRRVATDGRSMLKNIDLAVQYKYIKAKPGTVISIKAMGKKDPHKYVILCTGSQGEEFASLARMSRGEHKFVELGDTDALVMSSSVIPGNGNKITPLIDDFMRSGTYVYQYGNMSEWEGIENIHCSGHAHVDELKEMIQLTRPNFFLPIHGEYHHLVRHGMLAKDVGVHENNIAVVEDGHTVEMSPNPKTKSIEMNKGPIFPISPRMLKVHGELKEVSELVINDRKAMFDDGMFVVMITVSRGSGKLLKQPEIISRGFVNMKEEDALIQKAKQMTRKAVEGRGNMKVNSIDMRKKIRNDLSRYLEGATDDKPIILPVIIEV